MHTTSLGIDRRYICCFCHSFICLFVWNTDLNNNKYLHLPITAMQLSIEKVFCKKKWKRKGWSSFRFCSWETVSQNLDRLYAEREVIIWGGAGGGNTLSQTKSKGKRMAKRVYYGKKKNYCLWKHKVNVINLLPLM